MSRRAGKTTDGTLVAVRRPLGRPARNSRDRCDRTAARYITLLIPCLAVAASVASGDPASFQFKEQPGPYAVGLRVVEQYDYSRSYRHALDGLGRPFEGERARPLQVLIWYPAVRVSAKPMAVSDYSNLLATETNFKTPSAIADLKMDDLSWRSGAHAMLAQRLWAVRDAPREPGRYPIVVYAPSFSSMSWENADLCEYLASHGYLVLASPSLGVTDREMTLNLSGVTAQARDVSYLVGYAGTLANADASAVAVAGFSAGGLAEMVAAARDNRIDALVAFDGSFRYYPALVEQAAEVHPALMTIPLLSFSVPFSFEDQEQYKTPVLAAPNVLNAWIHGDLVDVHMHEFFHDEFASMYQRNEDVWWLWKKFFPTLADNSAREDGITGYAWVARYTLEFLDAYLKHDSKALTFLRRAPADNGVPRHVMTVSFRGAEGVAPSVDGLRAELAHRGFRQLNEIVATMRTHDAGIVLDEHDLDAWGQELIADGHLLEAIEVLALSVQMHPDSSGAFASLGDAQRQAGQTRLARDNYTEALKRNPKEIRAAKHLAELTP